MAGDTYGISANVSRTIWSAPQPAPPCLESGPRHLASRLIRPFPVQSDDAELDAVAHPDHPAVLGNRIIHRAPPAVGDENRRAAEPPRDGAGPPGLPGHFLDLLESDDLEVGIP